MNLISSNPSDDNRQWASSGQPVSAAAPAELPVLWTAGQHARSDSSAGRELDRELYETVLERVRKPGETVRAEDVLGDLGSDDS